MWEWLGVNGLWTISMCLPAKPCSAVLGVTVQSCQRIRGKEGKSAWWASLAASLSSFVILWFWDIVTYNVWQACLKRADFGHVLLEKADVQVPLRGTKTQAHLQKSEERWQSALLEGCIPDGDTESNVQLALRLALASTNIQCRCKQSKKKICIFLVGFTFPFFLGFGLFCGFLGCLLLNWSKINMAIFSLSYWNNVLDMSCATNLNSL